MVLSISWFFPRSAGTAFFEALRAPASYLPLAFLALAMAGLFWTEDTWPVGIQGLAPVSKLLAVPLPSITTNARSAGIGCCSRSWPPASS